MTFRDDTPMCLECEDVALDPVGKRFTCSRCTSVLIMPDELTGLLNELAPDDERTAEQRIFPTSGFGATCPRCTAKMTSGYIHDTGLERCTAHGIWLRKGELQHLLMRHADLYNERTNRDTRVVLGAFIPVLGVLLAGPVNAIILPWARRRRLRKYLAATTPPAAQK